MHRLYHWTQGHLEVLRAWQRRTADFFADWPRLNAIYEQLLALPKTQQTKWRRHCKATLWGVALCLAASGAQPGWADTITVDGATCTLVDAITTANSDTNTGGCVQTGTVSTDDVVELRTNVTLTAINNSTYGPTGLPLISSTITIAGNGHTVSRSPTAAAFRPIAINSTGDLTLLDTTLSGGVANVAPRNQGGGIHNRSGQLRLERCAVSGNSAVSGGGIYTLTHSNDTVSIIESTISGNSASTTGGGLRISPTDHSTVSIIDSTISGNSAANNGGGIITVSVYGTVSITNSTISGNKANNAGGGVISVNNFDSTLGLLNSTVSNNTAVAGGGMFSTTYYNGALVLHRSLIAGNTATGSSIGSSDEIRWTHPGVGGLLVSSHSLFGHSGVSTADALFGVVPGLTDILATSDGLTPTLLTSIFNTTLAANGGPTKTHNLVTGSPALDAAGATCGLTADQRNAIRPFDGNGDTVAACDIGAVEFGAPVCGDGITASPETCDDGNTANGDGCNSSCQNEAVCGDGVVSGSEACDQGSANGTDASCCSESCTVEPNSKTCRESAGDCDLAETCDGSSAECPSDLLASPSMVCRDSASDCDVAEHCTGSSVSCPADGFVGMGTSCGSADDTACDAPDSCDGNGTCVDHIDPSGIVCRPSDGDCDVVETCTGTSTSCPTDLGIAPSLGCTVNGVPNQPCQGTSGNDTIIGTMGNDTMVGLAGTDVLEAKAGDDIVCGGTGTDVLYGGQGLDTLRGGADDDALYGENGVDSLDGGAGQDLLVGGNGDDTLAGGTENDTLDGGRGVDALDGGSGTDALDGGPGEDTCTTGETLTNCP